MPDPIDPTPSKTDPDKTARVTRRAAVINLTNLFTGQSARAGYIAGADQAIISLANFLATIILARNITPTELGVYGVGFVMLRLIRAVQEGLVVQPLNVFGAAMDENDFRAYASSNLLIQIGLAICAALGVAVGGTILTNLGNDTAGPTLFALWFVFLTWQVQEFLRRVFYTRGMVPYALLNDIIANLTRLVLLLWWSGQGALDGAAGLNAIAWGAFAAIVPGMWQTRRFWARSYDNIRSTLRRNWRFGRWLMGSAIANWVAIEFYPILTAGLVSFAAAGAYRALQNLVAPIHTILRAADTFFTPRAARLYTQLGDAALARYLRLIYLVLGLPIAALLGVAIVFAEPLLSLLYGDTYLAYSNGILWMVVFYALLYAYMPLQSIFKATERSAPIFYANLAAIAVMFTIGTWAITKFDVYGTLAGQALNALIISLVLWGFWLRRRERGNEPAEPAKA